MRLLATRCCKYVATLSHPYYGQHKGLVTNEYRSSSSRGATVQLDRSAGRCTRCRVPSGDNGGRNAGSGSCKVYPTSSKQLGYERVH
eukprot:265233-Pyramimonas_sp.AAC.2